MSQYYKFHDTKKCIQCHACEVQCKINKSLPSGPKLCEVIEINPSNNKDKHRASYVFMSCYHCENALCIAACPTGAMQRREKDGIVFIDDDICVGCKNCIQSCFWGAPQWHQENGIVVKCDYCMDRIDEGLEPACVSTCITNCLHFDLASNIPNIRRMRYAKVIADSETNDYGAENVS